MALLGWQIGNMHGVSQGELTAQLEQLEGPWAPLAAALEGVTRGCSQKKEKSQGR